MTDKQNMRLALLILQHGDLEKAKAAEAFVVGNDEAQAESSQLSDSIYLVKADGSCELFNGKNEKTGWVGVAVKLGSKAVTVALHDAADGDDITLTTADDKTGWDGYKDTYLDATADWDGQGNTKHLQEIGLNAAIVLQPGQYIPSVGEMKLVQLFRKELNEALAYIGADEIADKWYWTSTEYSANNAWFLYLSIGIMDYLTKASYKYRVRPVSAFIS